jgi:mRNA interferase RelE/StbE
VAGYRVSLKPTAVKELDNIPTRDLRRITERIAGLAESPRPPGCEKLSGQDRYRVRQGDYRIVYAVDDREMLVTVVKVGHRREVYR